MLTSFDLTPYATGESLDGALVGEHADRPVQGDLKETLDTGMWRTHRPRHSHAARR